MEKLIQYAGFECINTYTETLRNEITQLNNSPKLEDVTFADFVSRGHEPNRHDIIKSLTKVRKSQIIKEWRSLIGVIQP